MPSIPEYDSSKSTLRGTREFTDINPNSVRLPDSVRLDLLTDKTEQVGKQARTQSYYANLQKQSEQKRILEKKEEADNRLWATKEFANFNLQQTQRLQELQQDRSVTNLTEAMSSSFDENSILFLESAPNDSARSTLEALVASSKLGYQQKAMTLDLERSMGRLNQDLTDIMDSNEKLLFNDPTQLENSLMSISTWLADHPSIDEAKSRDLFRKISSGFANSALQGLLYKIEDMDDLTSKKEAYANLKAEIEEGKWDKFFTSEQLVKSASGAQTMLQKVSSEIDKRSEQALRQQLQEYGANMDSHVESIESTGVPVVPRAQIAEIAKQLQDPSILEKYDQATKLAYERHKFISNFDLTNPSGSMPPAPVPGSPNYKEEKDNYEFALKYAKSKANAFIKDPVEYAKQEPIIQQAFAKSQAKGLQALVAYQTARGIPLSEVQLLSAKEAKSQVAQINSMEPEAVADYFKSLYSNYNINLGQGINGYDKLFEQLVQNKLNGNYGILASVADEPVARDLALAIKNSAENQKLMPVGLKSSDITNAVSAKTSNFIYAATAGGRMTGGQLGYLKDSMELLTRHYVVAEKMPHGQAVDKAYKQLVSDNYSTLVNNNSRQNIPKQIGATPINPSAVFSSQKELQQLPKISTWLKVNEQTGGTPGQPYAASMRPDLLSGIMGGSIPKKTGEFNESRPGHKHRGEDYAVPKGTSLRAPDNSVVKHVGFDPNGYGHYIDIVTSGGQEIRMAHLDARPKVNAGQSLTKGSVLGISGSSGRSTGPHVHIEIKNTTSKSVGPLIPGLPPGMTRDRLAQYISQKGIWLTQGNRSFLAVPTTDGGLYPLVNDKGKRYEFSYQELTSPSGSSGSSILRSPTSDEWTRLFPRPATTQKKPSLVNK